MYPQGNTAGTIRNKQREHIEFYTAYSNVTGANLILKPFATWSSDGIRSALIGEPNLGLLGQPDGRRLYYDRRDVSTIALNHHHSLDLCYHLPVYAVQYPKVYSVLVLWKGDTVTRRHAKIYAGRIQEVLHEDPKPLIDQISYDINIPVKLLELQKLETTIYPSTNTTCDFRIQIDTLDDPFDLQLMADDRADIRPSITVIVSAGSRVADATHKWAVFLSRTSKDSSANAFYSYESKEDECAPGLIPLLLNDHVSFPATTTIKFTGFQGSITRLTKDIPLSLTREAMRKYYCTPGSNLSEPFLEHIPMEKNVVLDRDATVFYWNMTGCDLTKGCQVDLEKIEGPDLYSHEVKLRDFRLQWTLDNFKHECSCDFSVGTFDQMDRCVRNSPKECVLHANAKIPLTIDRRDVCLSQRSILVYLDKHVLPPKFTKITRLNAFESRNIVTEIEPLLAEMQGLDRTDQCEALLTKSLPSSTVADASYALGLDLSVFKGVNYQTADLLLTAEATIRRKDIVGDKPAPVDMELSSINFVYTNISSSGAHECPDLVNNGMTIPEALRGIDDQMDVVPTNCKGVAVATVIIRPKSGFKCHVDRKSSDVIIPKINNYDYAFQLAKEHFHIYDHVQLSLVNMETDEVDCATYTVYDMTPIDTTLKYDILPEDICSDPIANLRKIGSGTFSHGVFSPNTYQISKLRRRVALILRTIEGKRCVLRNSRDGGALMTLSYPFSGRLTLDDDTHTDSYNYLWIL